MTANKITYQELLRAIEISFDGDTQICSLYDPNKKVETLQDIVADVSSKIKEYDGSVYVGIYEKKELAGYFVYENKMLISFALAIKYRTRNYLREFFRIIKGKIKKPFICWLWSVNTRAIQWLLKNDLKIISSNHKITKLLCQ